MGQQRLRSSNKYANAVVSGVTMWREERRTRHGVQGGGRGHHPRGQSNLKTLGGSCTQVPVAGGNHGKLMVLWGKQKRTGRAL